MEAALCYPKDYQWLLLIGLLSTPRAMQYVCVVLHLHIAFVLQYEGVCACPEFF